MGGANKAKKGLHLRLNLFYSTKANPFKAAQVVKRLLPLELPKLNQKLYKRGKFLTIWHQFLILPQEATHLKKKEEPSLSLSPVIIRLLVFLSATII